MIHAEILRRNPFNKSLKGLLEKRRFHKVLPGMVPEESFWRIPEVTPNEIPENLSEESLKEHLRRWSYWFRHRSQNFKILNFPFFRFNAYSNSTLWKFSFCSLGLQCLIYIYTSIKNVTIELSLSVSSEITRRNSWRNFISSLWEFT